MYRLCKRLKPFTLIFCIIPTFSCSNSNTNANCLVRTGEKVDLREESTMQGLRQMEQMFNNYESQKIIPPKELTEPPKNPQNIPEGRSQIMVIGKHVIDSTHYYHIKAISPGQANKWLVIAFNEDNLEDVFRSSNSPKLPNDSEWLQLGFEAYYKKCN